MRRDLAQQPPSVGLRPLGENIGDGWNVTLLTYFEMDSRLGVCHDIQSELSSSLGSRSMSLPNTVVGRYIPDQSA